MRNVKQFFRPTEKKSLFLNNDVQVGDSNNLPSNVSRRSLITYYSINYFLNKNYYNFLMQKNVHGFIFSVEKKSIPTGKIKVQRSVEFINYHPAESNVIIKLESKMIWLADVYYCVFFND